jgi:4-hydroxy-3-polyprenylbenzoate decarboxylase
VIDACKPYKWRDRFPDSNAATPEMARKAREMFGWLMEK